MKVRALVIAAVLACCASLAHAQAPLKLQISDGRVTLHAQNVPVRTILSEWARLGGARIVNGDRITGAPLTLDLESVPERQALDIILRGVSGYMLAARESGASGASMYDRIVILPTSVAPRNPPPAAAAPIFSGTPALVRPIVPRQAADDQDDNDDGNVAQGNDGVPLGRPTTLPRPLPPGALPVGVPVTPPIVVPDSQLPQPQTPSPVVVTPSNPFGLPAGSSVRPGVITPPRQPVPQGAGPRPQD